MSDSPRTDEIMRLHHKTTIHRHRAWLDKNKVDLHAFERSEAALREAISKLEMELVDARDDLEFVERWAVQHAAKITMSPESILEVIANYPAIKDITERYK